MRTRTKVTTLAVLGLLVLTVAVQPVFAWTVGCTPGYWKQPQHEDSWMGYAPDEYFDDVFGCGPHITLLEALKAKGGGDNALMRHAAAALLNAAHFLDPFDENYVKTETCLGLGTAGWEGIKDMFAGWNEKGCPLD